MKGGRKHQRIQRATVGTTSTLISPDAAAYYCKYTWHQICFMKALLRRPLPWLRPSLLTSLTSLLTSNATFTASRRKTSLPDLASLCSPPHNLRLVHIQNTHQNTQTKGLDLPRR